MDMRITSVNIGSTETLEFGRKFIETGIHKRPTTDTVWVRQRAVGADTIVNLEHHGGPDQAVYAYSADDYAWWSRELGTRVEGGRFGDNLTISGLPSDLFVGDRLLIGDTVLEATAPRIPCGTLAARMQDHNFGLTFRRAERPGIYFRVLNEGEVSCGDFVTLVENPERIVTILELFRFAYDRNPSAHDLERYLAAPLAERTRRQVEKKLAALDH